MRRSAHVPPIATLADLRLQVLAHNATRMPKWGFRLDPNSAVEIQPKPCILRTPLTEAQLARIHERIPEWQDPGQDVVRFDGRVLRVLDGDVPATAFRGWKPPIDARWIEVRFRVVGYADTPGVWEVQYQGARWSHALARSLTGREEIDTTLGLLVEAFTDGRFDRLTADVMLRHACLICGKGLTDPASMARWIGPECAGTSTLIVPGLLQAEATA